MRTGGSLLSTFLLGCGLVAAGQQPTPFGFGAQATGGGSATPQTPKDLKELTSLLGDSVPRVILIDKVFDFTDSENNATGPGCAPWPPCTSSSLQVQHALNHLGWCSQHAKPNEFITVNYRKAALDPLMIGHNKTIRGVGDAGVIRGKGLLVFRTKNIIIQNLHITWLNPELVWGGDALMINGGQDIWVDHCTFSSIGRQMIVLDIGKNTGITISNNKFDGVTEWSSTCLGKHYWTALLTGSGDQITMANNCFQDTSGRTPKLGGSGDPNVIVHYYNNLHTQTTGQSIEIGGGGKFLAEGNLFKEVYTIYPEQAVTEVGGEAYIPMTPAETDACKSYLGRPCVANKEENTKPPGSGGPIKYGKTKDALTAFENVDYLKTVNIQPASSLETGTPGGCGFGLL
ncbi:hypothetical protein CROQUDRAFT_652023 [Cronartium quercuum f. sp. fusiforme G11]|uniref:pectin lyase n=1 Tax=Cronartium quercuum f. sp. fusiforme G11 TaxID=708437 RepID=A0A9P6NSF3_9BASI|nr:hypothetical protein CROQUDRAFT_652023 [Cronartium quercuum f. sp. fusiforme G11]